MKDDINNIAKNSYPEESERILKVVIFGSQPKLIKQMSDQLFRKKILSRPVLEEKDLLANLSDFDPDLIFLEINGVTRSPIDQIVKVVFMWTKNYARKINKTLNSPSSRLWDKARVVLYRSDPEDTAFSPAGDAAVDLDEVLFKCKEAGDVAYIGLYSSWSFFSKIEPLLKKQ